MPLYGLKNCDTCRKALKALPTLCLIDVRTDGVPGTVLAQAYQTFGDALLNTRSTTWRGLSEQERARPPRELIVDYPTLMKRPLIVVDKHFFLGWNSTIETNVKALL